MNKIIVLLVAAICSTTSFAQEKKEEAEKPIPVAKSFVTTHQGTFGSLVKFTEWLLIRCHFLDQVPLGKRLMGCYP